jgi:hypothetical protein
MQDQTPQPEQMGRWGRREEVVQWRGRSQHGTENWETTGEWDAG